MRLYKWLDIELQSHINQSIDESVSTIRATLMSVGCSTQQVDTVCSESRSNMAQIMGNLRKDSLFLGRPLELVYAEILLTAHCTVINACCDNGAEKAIDLGFSTMARREFFEVFAAIDTRKMSDFYIDTIVNYMEIFALDGYAVTPASRSVMKDQELRLFDIDSVA